MATRTSPAYLSVQEAAALLKVHPNTIHRLIAAEKIHSIKVGSLRRIHRSSFFEQYQIEETAA